MGRVFSPSNIAPKITIQWALEVWRIRRAIPGGTYVGFVKKRNTNELLIMQGSEFHVEQVLHCNNKGKYVRVTAGPQGCLKSKSKSKLIYGRQSVGKSVLVSGSHLEPVTRFLFSVWRLRVSWCGAPSLTRGRVCNLLVQLLLSLARAVTLGSKYRRTNDHMLLSHLRLHQPWRSGPRIYIPQQQGGPVIPPATGFSFVASHDSHGYGGGILARLHTGTRSRGSHIF
jgi:hypothetical protein